MNNKNIARFLVYDKMMRRLFLLSLLVYLFPISHSCAEEKSRLVRVADNQEVSLEEIVDELKGVRLVFVGEHHDNMRHHQAQLAVIRALHEAGAPVAVGLEMFQNRYQDALDRWIQGGYSEEEFERIYAQNWNLSWALYRDIFVYARDRKLPMIALNVPSNITRQVAEQGFASLTEHQVGELPQVSCRVDARYMDFIRQVFGMHGHGGKPFVYFCEAQMVWDVAMAWHLLAYLEKHPDYTVVVLAGSGHAWKRGIPEQVRQRAQVPMRIILPQVPGQQDREKITEGDADYLWLGL